MADPTPQQTKRQNPVISALVAMSLSVSKNQMKYVQDDTCQLIMIV